MKAWEDWLKTESNGTGFWRLGRACEIKFSSLGTRVEQTHCSPSPRHCRDVLVHAADQSDVTGSTFSRHSRMRHAPLSVSGLNQRTYVRGWSRCLGVVVGDGMLLIEYGRGQRIGRRKRRIRVRLEELVGAQTVPCERRARSAR